MNVASKLFILAVAAAAPTLSAQQTDREPTTARFSVNLFRAPSTGVDYRLVENISAHAGFYPTVLKLRGERESLSFVRIGGTYWLRPAASGFYLSTGVALSLERESWDHSFANEAGYHQRLGSRWGARLGAIVLTRWDGEGSRFNPTIGLSFRPGARRVP